MSIPGILFVVGTRPEAIKLAPVIQRFEESNLVRPIICSTGQHCEMLAQAFGYFGLVPDIDLTLMRPNQSLAQLTGRAVAGLDSVIGRTKPAMVFVQGDTTSAMTGALAAYYRRVPIAHVEAGLRTYDRRAPFPEESNRRLIAPIADLHFAPTVGAARNLRNEGVREADVHVTGNTSIDALFATLARDRGQLSALEDLDGRRVHYDEWEGKRVLLVTVHRRENHGSGLDELCDAIDRLLDLPNIVVVCPVHPNPNVRAIVARRLRRRRDVVLTPPLQYPTFCAVMGLSYLILTDSGGVQEEAPSLGKPVLVMRETTERPEGIEVGNARLIGINSASIVAGVLDLWHNEPAYQQMTRAANPYGDGMAAPRIVTHTLAFLARGRTRACAKRPARPCDNADPGSR
jgi:UDP-N-acetylglucosamine 2-epimerase (non-hydrolysing)